jgi:hypothetical protein
MRRSTLSRLQDLRAKASFWDVRHNAEVAPVKRRCNPPMPTASSSGSTHRSIANRTADALARDQLRVEAQGKERTVVITYDCQLPGGRLGLTRWDEKWWWFRQSQGLAATTSGVNFIDGQSHRALPHDKRIDA